MARTGGGPTISLDAASAILHMESIPENVRSQLRANIPGITRKVADRVREKLQPGVLFKTTTAILPAVAARMVENVKTITGQVIIDPDKFPSVVANVLESGAVPHEIAAKNGGSLFFFWEKVGANVSFRKVNHPGFEGRSYMHSTFLEMQDEITESLTEAVQEGARRE